MEKETLSRRSFLNKLWLVLGTVAFAEFIAMVFTFFKPRKQKVLAADADRIIIAGPVDSFELLSPARSRLLYAENSTLPGSRMAASWPCRALAHIWPAPFHGYQRRRNSSAPAILQNLTYGARLQTLRHPGHWIFTRSVSRTTCSRWIPENSGNGLYLQRIR